MNLSFDRIAVLALVSALLSGCGAISFKASTNSKAVDGVAQSQQASFELRDKRYLDLPESTKIDCSPKKHKDVLVLLALSGGGSRAALMSGLSMIQMQDVYGVDVLSEVDVISSVSGGSLAAGYYAISGDPNAKDECGRAVSGRVWNKNEVTRLMSKNYIFPWFGNWFWPDNILLYWFSTYDRTDMMAQTFADNLFDTDTFGRDLQISHLNPARPNLIINATQGSSNATEAGKISNGFGQPFTFTREDFSRICSRIDDYDVSRAVMASATFPGVFNFMTLKNYCAGDSYIHVFDGGNSDNLGLNSIKRVIWNLSDDGGIRGGKRLSDYRYIIVVLIDAYTNSSGVNEKDNDPRKWYDYIVDTNFITATDSLLAKNRDNLITQFETKNIFAYSEKNLRMESIQSFLSDVEMKGFVEKKRQEVALACRTFFSWKKPEEAADICTKTNWEKLNNQLKNMMFVHVDFSDITNVSLNWQLNNIPTSFKINDTDKGDIECAVPLLFGQENNCGGNKYMPSEAAVRRWKEVRDVLQQSKGPGSR